MKTENKQHPNERAMLQNQKANLDKFRYEVEILDLKDRKNKLQKSLFGVAIDAHVDAFISIELAIEQRRPELLPILTEERNAFLLSVNVSPDIYVQALNQDRQSRKEQVADNPSDQLHAIHEEIKKQPTGDIEAGEVPADLPAEPEHAPEAEADYPELPPVETADVPVGQPESSVPVKETV